MKQLALTLLTLLTLRAGVAQKHDPARLPAAEWTPKIEALVKQYVNLDIFSGVVLIAENGKPVFQQAYGLANREKNIPNTRDTRFDIGSINKLFTKALVLQLIQEGKLRPEDPLGKYLKGFPEAASKHVTIDQLISHRSGYGDYMQQPGFFERPGDQQTIGAILEMIKAMPLQFEPGTEQAYSNAGYVLLGGIIEAATGKSYYQNIRERIVEPLGMRHTVVDTDKARAPKRAIGYLKTMRGALENNEGILLVPTPAGGFVTTAEDLLLFMEAYFYTEKLVRAATLELDEFYPFIQDVRKNGGAIPVAGGFQGANAVVYNALRDHQTIIVLANMDEPVAEQLAAGIFALMRGKEPRQPTLPALQTLYQAYKKQGPAYVKKHFETLTINSHSDDPKDMLLNNMGYNLLYSGETDDALEVFKLNTELFPNIANCWDSYGEALLQKGDRTAALKAYRKALEIRPGLPSAREAVERLERN